MVINKTNFPDNNFREFVDKKITHKEKEKITDAELQAVTTMDVSKKSIQNLKGIEYFTALTSLICYGNKLKELDVRALTNLETLECYDNSSMTSLIATGCTKLTTLKCNNCKLKTISLERCSNLQTLRCYKNNLRDDDMVQFISKLPRKARITYLDLCYNNEDADAGNKIMHAEVRAAKAKNWIIRKYDGSSWKKYTGIIAVDETTFPDANFLACVGQYDTDSDGILSDDEVAKVTEMYVDSKGIQDMTGIECFENLTDLSCYKNQIQGEAADNLVSYLPTVEGGDLYFFYSELITGNYLTEAQLVAVKAKGWNVYQRNNSKWVDYVSNHFTGICIDETTFPDNSFRAYVSDYCDPDGDGYLSDEEVAAVKEINDAMIKPIGSFQGIEYFTQLEKLRIGNFQGTSLDLLNLTHLTYIYCDSEVITSLNVSGCSQLETLTCYGNKLSSIDVSGCTQLGTLNCQQTALTSLDVSDCKQVCRLNIYNNPQLTSLKVSDLPLLKELHVENCQLTTLDLSNCTSLPYLTIYRNPLTSLNVSRCTSLHSLNASGMQLTSLNVTGCTNLSYIAIDTNQLKGEGMDMFIESVPVCATTPEDAYFNCMSIFDPAEGNRLTPAQAAKLREKGWPVQAYYKPYGTRLDYDGYGNGDVDGSGTVDADDVRAVVNHILGLADTATDTDTDVEWVAARAMEESATPFYSPIVADTNGDGVVDIADVTQIISKVGTVVYKKPEK